MVNLGVIWWGTISSPRANRKATTARGMRGIMTIKIPVRSGAVQMEMVAGHTDMRVVDILFTLVAVRT